jgi:hypothetical protein
LVVRRDVWKAVNLVVQMAAWWALRLVEMKAV